MNHTTYSDLAEEISQSGNIKLKHKNYTYDTGANAITITEDNKVIDGNGAVIDMKGSTIRAFDVIASGVTIKNLTIKNADYNGKGGAIYFSSSGTVINCNFTGNRADYGGAVYFFNQGTVINCNFVDNSASRGGAVWMASGNVSNCNFVNNRASIDGGAVFCENGDISFSIFKSNWDGAIYAISKTHIHGCVFNHQPSAVWTAEGAEVAECHFNYCSPGEAVANEGVFIKDSYFIEYTLDEARKVVDRLNHTHSYLNGFDYYDIEGNTLYINTEKLQELVDALAETVSVASYGGACSHGRHTAFEEFLRGLQEQESTRLLQLYPSSTYGIRPNAVCKEVFDGKEVAYRNFNALVGLLPELLPVIQEYLL